MAKKIVLCWRAKTPRGWRHFPCLFHKQHGKVLPRHGWVLDSGREVEYPEGRYELRSYSGGKMVYTPIEGCHPAEAQFAFQRAQKLAQTTRTQKADPLHTVNGAIAAYLRDLDLRKKPEMKEKAAHVLKEFRFFCLDDEARKQGQQGKVYLLPVVHTRRVTREHVLGFHSWLRQRGNSERTIHDKHMRVAAWLKFCKIDTSFMPKPPKFEKSLPTIYSPTQLDDIRAAADDEMRLAIDLCWQLGLREREATHAEWDDIDWQHAEFRVRGKVREQYQFAVKDSEQRDVPIPGALLARLKAWREAHPSNRLILGGKSDQPEGHLLRKLKALARNNSLNCGKCDGCQRKGALAECEEWELHKFRRTYCTSLLRGNIDLATAQRWMGHSDLASTMRYIRSASNEEMQGKVNNIFGD